VSSSLTRDLPERLRSTALPPPRQLMSLPPPIVKAALHMAQRTEAMKQPPKKAKSNLLGWRPIARSTP
jgi:hypothetical protein